MTDRTDYMRQWRRRNADRIREYMARYRKENTEQIAAVRRSWVADRQTTASLERKRVADRARHARLTREARDVINALARQRYDPAREAGRQSLARAAALDKYRAAGRRQARLRQLRHGDELRRRGAERRMALVDSYVATCLRMPVAVVRATLPAKREHLRIHRLLHPKKEPTP